MSPLVALPEPDQVALQTQERTVPWYVYAVVVGAASIIVGLIWDISWHRSVGRDTFWTAAHLAIYLGGILGGASGGFLALKTTFAGTPGERAAAVRFWGFRAPLGAWVCIWGAIAMVTSAPFDDWWHNAYGLDVEIISPPHTLLALGMFALMAGALLLVLAQQNRADAAGRNRYGFLFAFVAGAMIAFAATFVMAQAGFPNHMHSSTFYKVTGGVFPFFLIGAARASRLRWPATTVALVYMGIILVMAWVLPRFSATPGLAPIYNPITHMVPPPFPLLLVAPALVLDLLMHRFGAGRDWSLAFLAGLVFLAVMLAVHWYWSGFLLSPAARNPFFVADYWEYSSRLGPWRYEFWGWSSPADYDADGTFSLALFWKGIGYAALLSIGSARLGLWWGNWMQRVRR
jgi:hypothetical protein